VEADGEMSCKVWKLALFVSASCLRSRVAAFSSRLLSGVKMAVESNRIVEPSMRQEGNHLSACYLLL
jgi:hypothetical protein